MTDLYFSTTIKGRLNIEPKDMNDALFGDGGTFERYMNSKYSGVVHPRTGYIKPGSVKITKRSQGKIDGSHFTGAATCNIELSVMAIRPQKGMKLTGCLVIDINKIAVIARPMQSLPFIICLPIIDATYDILTDVKKGMRVDIAVIDAKLLPPNKDRQNSSYWIIGELIEAYTDDRLINTQISHTSDKIEQMFSIKESRYGDVPRTLYTKNIQIGDLDIIKENIPLVNEQYLQHFNITEKSLENDVESNDQINKKLLKWDDRSGKIVGSFWDHIKAYINKHELIVPLNSYKHLVNKPIPMKKNIIGRAYYKMHEMLNTAYPVWNGGTLIDHLDNKPAINVLCLGEAPGGFIQSLIHNRQKRGHMKDNITAISITTDSFIIPGHSQQHTWQKLLDVFKNNEKVAIYWDNEKTPKYEFPGATTSVRTIEKNLYDPEMLSNLHAMVGTDINSTKRMDFISADGRNDISSDKLKDEEMYVYKLIFTEIIYALTCQARGGTFVLKIFDMFTDLTVNFINYLVYSYETVYVTKPHTSRGANSEKYLVCINFKGIDEQDRLIKVWNRWLEEKGDVPEGIVDIFTSVADDSVKEQITNYNDIFLNEQINLIRTGVEYGNLYLAKDPHEIKNIINENIHEQQQKREEWFTKYNFQI